PEVCLALVDEDLLDRAAGAGLDVVVGVAHLHPPTPGQLLGDGGLAGAHRADQDDTRGAHLYLIASRYALALRAVSPTESPPNFSVTASASTRATIASATTPAAGTAQTSERWWWAAAVSPVATSTVRRARGTVEIGFIPARTRSTPPVLIPPSVPPARSVERQMPSGPTNISSWAAEPRRVAVVKPSPISTPLMAWMPMIAPASCESSRRSQWVNEPSPGGRP